MKESVLNIKCPKKCYACIHHKVLNHGVKPYNYCTKIDKSFCGDEPKEFFDCNKSEGA